MTLEADRFIAAMPEGLQQRQEAAVRQAIDGDSAPLNLIRASRNTAAPLPEGVTATDIDGKYRLYRRSATDRPKALLIYLHGGGWCFGSINSCSKFCGSLAQTADIAVLAVEYPLAPEHPYPAALECSLEAVNFAIGKAADLGIDPDRISIGGDSAGGNLALVTALRLTGTKALNSLVLFYPVVKAWNDHSDSWQKYSIGYGLDGSIMEAFNTAYSAGNDPRQPYISPATAPDSALAQLPPTLIVNAGRDILLDQGSLMHSHLTELGVDSRHHILKGATHLFITVDGQPTAFNTALRLTADFLEH